MPLPALSPYNAAARALDALLSREPWAQARLAPHAGKIARLVMGMGTLTLQVSEQGGVVLAPADAVPNVTLTVATDKLSALMSADTAQRMSAVRIDGDAALAHVIGDLARDLRWDAEDDVAKVIGDIPAARLFGFAHGVAQGARTGARRFAENVAEYLSEESGAVASSYELEAWSAGVRKIRDDSERAAKRVDALAARLDALEARRARSQSKG